jgi:hypothetical protein
MATCLAQHEHSITSAQARRNVQYSIICSAIYSIIYSSSEAQIASSWTDAWCVPHKDCAFETLLHTAVAVYASDLQGVSQSFFGFAKLKSRQA